MSRIPVKLRVTLVFAAVMAIVLAATGLFLYLRLQSSLNRSIDQDVQSRSQQLIKEMRVADTPLAEAARSLLRNDNRAADFAQVLTAAGGVLKPGKQHVGPAVLSPSRAAEAARGEIGFERPSHGVHTQPERYIARPFEFEGRTVVVVVGASLADRNAALASLLRLLLIGGPIALLLASLAAYATVGAALRPVEAMRRRAAEVSASGSQQRLPVPPARDELHRLGESLNEMLDRLETALQRERAFVDDASHELRTPLAAHKMELELALLYGGTAEEMRGALASAIEEADRLSQLAESLLVIARSDKGKLSLKLEPIEIANLFVTMRDRMSDRAGRDGRELRFDDESGAAVEADRMRVEQAVGNLVENALRHGAGPIRVWSHRRNGRIEIHVRDEGAGFPPDFLPHAFERFRRADTSRSSDGTGLGLAIDKASAEAHGGTAAAQNANGGGADVWIELAATSA
jgi:two-component system OmpR family sensor kinase